MRHGADQGAFANLGADLAGQVLVRCSGALWKKPREHFDVLGMALRFRQGLEPFDEHARAGDQDLLFATIRSPFTMVFSPFTTNAHDFLANEFFAVAPFEIHGHDRAELRLVALEPPAGDGPRNERLRTAVAAGRCVWHLEARKTLTRTWHAVARVVFEREIELDQEALRFDAFRTRDTLIPVGVVHSIRRAVYASSQHARPSHARRRDAV
ncbi:MAG TPA: hypothetical protein VK427_16140 [Kofleriaceae bacterium]|nr:hypothetical protein [Kofleriaceae bacterium]